MKSQRPRKRTKPFFSPDVIATTIAQAIDRDLRPRIHESHGPESPLSFVARAQLASFQKKYVSEQCDKASLEELTFKKFLDMNEHMSKFREMKFPDPKTRVTSKLCKRDKILLRARALMHFVLTPFDEDEYLVECKNSSGSSIGVPYSDTSEEAKFTFPITVTQEAKPLFDYITRCDSELHRAIEDFNSSNPVTDWCKIVKGSRATTVDKTDTIRRLIAVEPTANMYLQQGLMAMMYRRMKNVGLDVESLPTEHRELALESSITARKATIDFTSASDCVSTSLLTWLLPPRWLSAVQRVRSPYMTLNGRDVELNMFSTMGNAVTFPLETLVFWTLAHACRLTANDKCNTLFPEWEDLKVCSVFGDDCIVPTPLAPMFMEVMESVGFIVNKEKSFFTETGQFRESCGGDYLAGYNVRPYYLKAPTSNRKSALEPWLYIIGNSLLKKYISYFGELSYVYDKEFFRVLFSLFRRFKLKIKLVPDYLPDDAGLKISSDLLRFINHYNPPMEDIARDKHGTYTFRYCRFLYRKRQNRHDYIRYAIWLKARGAFDELLESEDCAASNDPLSLPGFIGRHVRLKRKIGGYVVARGLSSHWTIPTR